MTVIEFALLHLRRAGQGDTDLLEALCQCLEIQDQWIDENQPHLRQSSESLSSIYLQQDKKEPCLLITAPWDSPSGHQEWIDSKENQGAMSRLIVPYLAEDAPFQLFHVEHAGRSPRLPLDYEAPHASLNMSHIEVDPASRASVEKEYRLLEDDMHQEFSKRQVWAGWKIEKDATCQEKLIMFWDAAVQSRKLDNFLSKFEAKDTRSFRSICSESICKL